MARRTWRNLQICFVFGVILILFEIIFLSIFLVYSNISYSRKSKLLSDLYDIYQISTDLKIPLYVLDNKIFQLITETERLEFSESVTLLGIDARFTKDVNGRKFLQNMESLSFKSVTFYNEKILISVPHDVAVAYLWKRHSIFHCLLLQTREDNTWWFGNLLKDPEMEAKLVSLGLDPEEISINYEGIIDKFEAIQGKLKGSSVEILVPKYPFRFLHNLTNAHFVECNTTRAAYFKMKYSVDNTLAAQRFRHRAWKLLAKVKTILDILSVTFWISSGTCLGYFRECDIIAHSLDVDIGIFATNYTDKIITEMEAQGLGLKHWFGKLEDSLELSFIDTHGLKLDIFFFYEDGDYYWNGGTQAKSGRKFRYLFPKFRLCWTLFKELKIRVPCDTETYIYANYGPNWFMPVKKWDWKTSPHNVQPNGFWPKDQWADVIKIV